MASFTNMATLSYNGSQINSNVVTGELLDALTVTKTAVSGSYQPGDTVTYVVTLTNTGTALTGLTLTDDLGGYTAGGRTVYPLAYEAGTLHYYTGGTEQTAPAVTAGPPMTVTGVTVPAGGNVTLVYQARVTEFAPPGVEGEIRNTVTVTGGGAGGSPDGHGHHGGAGRTGAEHQQGSVPRCGHRQWAPDLYLYRSKHRQHCPDRPGGRGDHRYL